MSDESELVLVDQIDPGVPPEETKWKVVRTCCWKDIALVMPSDRLFCEHWEINLFMPVFVCIIVAFCYLCFLLSTLPALESAGHKYTAFTEVSISLGLFLWSYMAAMCMDPGYLPYNWAVSQRTKYTWQEQLSGLAIRSDQMEYAETHKPPFASFSHQAGRFVIRGDHICGWVSNWIGKRNHKQFTLMTFWGSILCISLIAWQFMRDGRKNGRDGAFWCDLTAMCTEAIFACVLIHEFCCVIWDIYKNRTQIQKWQGTHGPNIGCFRSFKQIFGSNNILLWCCPTPAFGDVLSV